MKPSRIAVGMALLGAALACTDTRTPVSPPRIRASLEAPNPVARAALGRKIFFDQTLSLNENQSCASCHAPEVGWTGPLPATNAHGAVYEGSIPGAFGNRKPPSSAYATQSPIFNLQTDEDGNALFVGGLFWDGRATGETLGCPAAEQAKGPFLNPAEQALPSAADLVGRVCSGTYAGDFIAEWGEAICDPASVDDAYDAIGISVQAFEGSPESNAFTSKFDAYRAGRARLTPRERAGLELFQGAGQCAACHVLDGEALFTDFTYDNLGIPRNPENPAGLGWTDPGLAGFLQNRTDFAAFAPESHGKHKVPTLRNVDLRPRANFVKAYGHNGYFKTLEGIVHFYNTRDVLPACPGPFTEAEALKARCWPAPEVSDNVNTTELGNLHLSPKQEREIVAFLKTLSDGYRR